MSQHQHKAKTAVHDLVSYHLSASPVDIKEIARRQGVTIIEHEMDPKQSAMLIRKNGRAAIVVNKLHHARRQRFSIAHELGHLLMHKSEGRAVEDGGEIFHRHEYHRPSSPQETQANYFAAELLMPEQAVRKAVQEVNLSMVTDLAVQQLARKFDVSVAAMTIRLQTLGLLEEHW